ncbi:MAG TPA: glutaredoxin family protein [Burkholderiales bacterium]
MTRLLAACLVLLAAGTALAQGIYRWTDEKGKVHYGTHPPASAKARQLTERINSYSGPAEVRHAPAVPASTASAAGPGVMYSTSWCTYCAQARAYFARNGISYQEYDVEKSAAAHAEFKRLGGKGVPLILHGRQAMSGFSEQAFKSLVARSSR